MNCQEVRELLLDSMDGELPASIQQEVAQHLRSCSACREELESYRKTSLLLQLRAVPEPAPDYWDRTWEKIRSRSRARVLPLSKASVFDRALALPAIRPGWRKMMAVAALVVFIVASALFLTKSGESQRVTRNLRLETEYRAQPVSYPAKELPIDLRRQIEMITLSRVAAGSIDPISKSMLLARMEVEPK